MCCWRVAIILILCMWAVSGEEEAPQNLTGYDFPLVASFQDAGFVVAPTGFHHVQIDLKWSEEWRLIKEGEDQIKSAVKDYTDTILAGRDVGKKERVKVLKERLHAPIARFKDAKTQLQEVAGQPTRQKRGIWEWAATLINFGITTSNGKAIDKVVEMDHVLHDNQMKLQSELQDFQNFVKGWMIVETESRQDELFLSRVQSALQQMTDMVMKRVNAIYELDSDVPSAYWLSADRLTGIMNNLTVELEARELTVLGFGLAAMLEAPKSHAITKESVSIIFHIPVVPLVKKEPMRLLRLVNARAAGHGLVLELTTKRSFVAMGRHTKHFVTSEEELALCLKVGQIHLCPENRIFTKIPSECASCLLFEDDKCALKYCRAQWVPNESPIVPVGQDSYLLQKTTNAVRRCEEDGQIRTSTHKQGEIVDVSSSCTLEAVEAIVEPRYDKTVVVQMHEVRVNLNLNVTSQALEILKKKVQDFNSTLAELEPLPEDPMSFTTVLLIAGGVGAVVILMIVGGSVYWCCVKESKQAVQQAIPIALGAMEGRIGVADAVSQVLAHHQDLHRGRGEDHEERRVEERRRKPALTYQGAALNLGRESPELVD